MSEDDEARVAWKRIEQKPEAAPVPPASPNSAAEADPETSKPIAE
jgi:hypothetical protein